MEMHGCNTRSAVDFTRDTPSVALRKPIVKFILIFDFCMQRVERPTKKEKNWNEKLKIKH